MKSPGEASSSIAVPPWARSSAGRLAQEFAQGASLEDHLARVFAHIEACNPQINAVTSLEQEAAYARAQALRAAGPSAAAPLFGVPVLIKEVIQKKGFSVQCASRILAGYRGQYTATAVEHLERAGAIAIGTTNMDEFAMGSTNETSVHGPVRNPVDFSHVSGGSSGGSAAAVAAGFAPVALGSDTGGSVRQPAAWCGILGYKPSYGRVSRYGLVAYASSLDQIAPFGTCTRDIDLAMEAMGRQDPRDPTSLPGAYTSQLGNPQARQLRGKRIGIVEHLELGGLAPAMAEAYSRAKTELSARGAELVPVRLETLPYLLASYYLIATAEASSNLARFDGIRYGYRHPARDLGDLYTKTRGTGFGPEVKLRILLGTFALRSGYYEAYYGRAQSVRRALKRECEDIFRRVDALLLPTTPSSAPKLGARKNSMDAYLVDVFTIPANLAGLCAISLPVPGAEPLPLGLQLVGPGGGDADLVALAGTLEEEGLVHAVGREDGTR